MGRIKDISGMTFHRWAVLERRGKNSRGEALWYCRCSCDNEKEIVGSDLRSGKTKSCGCLRRMNHKERAQILNKVNRKSK